MTQERRQQERFNLDLKAKISFRHVGDTSHTIDTVAANVSPGGAFITTTHKFPMAAKVKIEFFIGLKDLQNLKFVLSLETLKTLKSEKIWVNTTGIVIRQANDGIGIIFDTDYQLTPVSGSTEK